MKKKNSTSISRPTNNDRLTLTLAPSYISQTGETINVDEDGSEGSYKVLFVLSKPGKRTHVEDLDLDRLLESGESFLLGIHDSVITADNEAQSLNATFKRNQRGEYARVDTEIFARNFTDAEIQSHGLVLPILSQLSFVTRTPIDILGYHLIEEQTGAQRFSYHVLGTQKQVDWPSFELWRKSFKCIRPLLSAYREGLNSSNPFFQLLCFYKITEGVKKLTGDRAKLGEKVKADPQRIPKDINALNLADDFHRSAFEKYLGRKFNEVLRILGTEHRNAVAHLTDVSDSHQADSFEDTNRCRSAALVARYIAEQMLRTEIQLRSGAQGDSDQ